MVLTAWIAREVVKGNISLSRTFYRSIEDEAAEILSQSDLPYLELGHIISISPKAAESLSGYRGHIDLSGIGYFDDVSAGHLAKCQGRIRIHAIRFLKATPGHLALVEKVVECSDKIEFYFIEVLEDEVAFRLSKFNGCELYIGNVDRLNDTPGHIALLESFFRNKNLREIDMSSIQFGGLARFLLTEYYIYSLYSRVRIDVRWDINWHVKKFYADKECHEAFISGRRIPYRNR